MRGGARSHSGPPPDPNSARSDQRGFRLSALPPEGYQGKVPRFPLPARVCGSDEETHRVMLRERSLWRWAWRTPQAWGWAQPQEMWRIHTVAMWVRTFVVCEGSEATAADKGSLHRFADQVGFTDAGLRMMGWKVAAPTVDDDDSDASPDAEEGDDDEPTPRRLRAV